ncbi:MAG TPA: gliding motility lipoprotein GldH [Bacteroidales bacterium]|jgi:gliding motility-associated lipoprotein GldH|nr:gliding motility lipoprotein GldH [Bacteroidales bacterium]
MIAKTNKYLPLLLVLLAVLASCGRDVVFSGSAVMEKNTWDLMNKVSFEIPVNDTVNSNNILFTIRTGNSYPFRNIYLFVTTYSPDGKTVGDTIQYYLADEKGEWYGKGFGDIKELNLPYKSNVYFPRKGTYRITVQHGMRTEELKGVYDFGLKVVRISK